MKPGRGSSLSLFVEMVRKYQGQIVPPVDTESTLVPLARTHAFSRLSEYLTDSRGANEQQKNRES
jgi:hypothetical protein